MQYKYIILILRQYNNIMKIKVLLYKQEKAVFVYTN